MWLLVCVCVRVGWTAYAVFVFSVYTPFVVVVLSRVGELSGGADRNFEWGASDRLKLAILVLQRRPFYGYIVSLKVYVSVRTI